MSNYCKSCRYDPAKRTGDDACPFNPFYWDFLLRHEEQFNENQRMKLMMSHVRKINKQEKVELRVSASKRREEFGIGSVEEA
jgi:deoxyribodipyrimidine photolyase-related protein